MGAKVLLPYELRLWEAIRFPADKAAVVRVIPDSRAEVAGRIGNGGTMTDAVYGSFCHPITTERRSQRFVHGLKKRDRHIFPDQMTHSLKPVSNVH